MLTALSLWQLPPSANLMANHTIYNGPGATGLRVLEELRHCYYGTFGSTKPDHVELIFTETDTAVERHPTRAGNSIESVYRPLDLLSKAVVLSRINEISPTLAELANCMEDHP